MVNSDEFNLNSLNDDQLKFILNYIIKRYDLVVSSETNKSETNNTQTEFSDSDTENNEFSQPKRPKIKATSKKNATVNPIETYNRFQTLNQDNDDIQTDIDNNPPVNDVEMAEGSQKHHQTNVSPSMLKQFNKPPPIILRNKDKWFDLSIELRNKKIN